MSPAAIPSVSTRILALLDAAGIVYRTVEHAPTLTSADSAAARGEPLGCGAKALLLKCDGTFRLLVMPADRKLNSKLARAALGVKDLRFASREELLQLTGLVPGSVPPFGAPILPFPLYADTALGTAYPQVAFNAGDLTRSVIMRATDWEALAKPVRLTFAEIDAPAAS